MAHNNRKQNMKPYTLKDFQKQFPDDATCLDWLFRRFNPDGMPYCHKCEKKTKHHRVISRPSYSCDSCGNHYHPTADTIFHKSPTPLTIWFYAVYLMAQTRCGISAKQIQRETGVTYKTAWRMFKQIRSMLDENESGKKLGGKRGPGVEMDETYMGGVQKMGAGRKPRNPKTAVFGIAERQGRVRAFTTENVQSATLLPIIREHVMPKSTVFTDERNVYDGVGYTTDGYWHRRIQHNEKVYVMGNVHTNTVEGFWSLVKRGIGGVYHNVGRHYLQTYLNEYSFRYNRRFDTQPMFLSFLKQVEKRDAVVRESVPTPEPF
ncbi:MAG TPA: IS1595 family transposase [Terriglobales bacterium]|nr:IS1595 family transposase [Terriglobales bacterium]